MSILIITQDFDPTADPVVEELTRRGQPPVRFDLADFPQQMTVVSDEFTHRQSLHVRGVDVDLTSVRSVWYRRPTQFQFDDALKDNELEFAALESALGIGGVLRSMGGLWLNRPDLETVGHLKPYQLALAARLGLRTPRTLITNDPGEVEQLLDRGGRYIYKVFGLGPVQVAGEVPAMLFTTEITDLERESLQRVRHTPCIIQELVEKKYEIRMTVIGRTLLLATIDSQSDEKTALDWRGFAGEQMRYVDTPELPAGIVDQTCALMDALGLNFATLDFIVTPSDDWIFLEVNPSGQFMWLEEEIGLPMAATMADTLLAGEVALLQPPRVILGESSIKSHQ